MSLLSLSLNAQVILERTAQTDPNAPASFQGINRAPQKIDLPSGQYLVGPYTTDAFDTNGAGMPSYTGKQLIGVMLEPADFEQYLGSNVVAFRAAYVQENDVYDYFIYQMKLNDDSTYTMGAKQMLTPEYNYSQYKRYDGGSWYIEYVTDPMVLHLDEGYNRLLIGYEYRQYSTTGYSYPLGKNSQSTGHHHYNYDYSYNDWYYVNMTGDLAMQLIVESAAKSTPPTIHYSYNQEAQTVTIWLEGEGDMHMYINGAEVSFPITLGCGSEERIVSVSGTAQQEGLAVSDPVLQNITIPQATVEMTADPSITSSVGEINVQINGIGDGEVHMYVGNQEVTNPYYLERLEEDYDVVVTVTAQEEGKGMSMTTQTIHVPARGAIDLTGWTQLPGTYTQNEVINWGKSIMFIDRFTASTANNTHPRKYDYVLQEVKAPGDTTADKTNTQIVPVMHTGGVINGYYTEDDVINDKDMHMEIDLMNADFQMDLERNGDIYYYTMDRSKNNLAESSYIELTKPQHNLDNTYTEMGNYFNEEPKTFNAGIKHRLDTVQAIYHKGEWGTSFMSYVPIVWTFGNLPSNLRVDGGSNSYGSPIWKTGVGKTNINYVQIERQAGANQSTNWNMDSVPVYTTHHYVDVDTIINGQTVHWSDTTITDTTWRYTPCSLYMVKTIDVDGWLPNEISNIEYEPYMFRVWAASPTGKLRNYTLYPADSTAVLPGEHYGDPTNAHLYGPVCIWEEFYNDTTHNISSYGDNPYRYRFWKEKISHTDSLGHWDVPENMNMIFAAEDSIKSTDVLIFVRFYYRSTGEAKNQNMNTMFMLGNRDGDEEEVVPKEFYTVQDSDNPDDEIPTSIKSVYDLTQGYGELVSVTYYNLQGVQSSRPFDGINIVVKRYSDGHVTSSKVMFRR